MPVPATAQTFIAKWHKASGSERANYRLFIDCDKERCHKNGSHQCFR